MNLRAPAVLLAALLALAGCADHASLLETMPPPGPALAALECAVDVGGGPLQCRSAGPAAGGASRNLVFGGQNVFVRLASTNAVASAGRLTLDVTVENLIGQALGTTNGVDPHADGVRVFFNSGPTALPAGAASIGNADGTAIFLAGGQPYFQYDGVLEPGETSAPRTWEFTYEGAVERIAFTVYVAAPVRHQEDWVDVPSEPTFLLPGDTVRLSAVVRDRFGRPTDAPITWRTSDPAIATVDDEGLVRAVGLGIATIHTDSDTVYGGAPVVVVDRETAVRMDVQPDSVTLEMGETVQLTAQTFNLRGERLDDHAVWADGSIWVAVVDGSGLVRATYPGQTGVMGVYQWAEDVTVVTVNPGPDVAWKEISAGQGHTCGVTTTNRPFCWGANTAAQLGIGMWNQYGENIPVRVAGGYGFVSVSAGNSVSCGLSGGGPVYCWGTGYYGQLGNGETGSLDLVATPVQVTGGHAFSRVAAGWEHVCGIRTDGAAYCWGNNTYGQLGNGTFGTFDHEGPVPVSGGHEFREISAGRGFNCAITTADDLYCWGDNNLGQLGDGAGGPAVNVPEPVLVAGGRKWKAVSVWDQHACGLTTDGAAYCWGVDRVGELGRGVVGDSTDVPAPVATGERFLGIAVGSRHSCAVSIGGVAYCWGYDEDGQLGRGTKDAADPHPVPLPVVTSVAFAGPVDLGQAHSCALGTDGRAYCWGQDFEGEAGAQPDGVFCYVPGGTAPCHPNPRRVENPRADGGRTGPVPSRAPAPGGG